MNMRFFLVMFLLLWTPASAVELRSIEVSGVTLTLGDAINAEVQKRENKRLSSALLEEIRASVFQIYSDAGYFARVTFPEQDLSNGVLRVEVEELSLGEVTARAAEGVRFDPVRAEKYVTQVISSAKPLSIDELDQQSTVLDGLNGIAAEQAVSFPLDRAVVDVEISIEGTEFAEFSAQIDNFGTESTGRERASLDAQYNSLLSLGDRLVLSAAKSDALTSGSFDLEVPVGYRGQRAVVGKSKSEYKINSGDYKLVGASDRDWMRFRSSEFLILNSPFTIEAGIERSTSIDRLNDTTISTDKSTIDRYLSGSFDWVNSASSAAANVSVRLTFGELDLSRNKNVLVADAKDGKTHGRYEKLALSIAGQRKLSPQNSLTLTSACQFSSKNLDSVSELEISGPSAVRAYDVAAVSVDQGCFAQTEFVHQQNEQRAFFGFFDLASGKTNQTTWENWNDPGGERNEFSIFGAGVGTRLNIADKFNLSITYAKRLGACEGCVQAQAQDRLWAALTVTF